MPLGRQHDQQRQIIRIFRACQINEKCNASKRKFSWKADVRRWSDFNRQASIGEFLRKTYQRSFISKSLHIRENPKATVAGKIPGKFKWNIHPKSPTRFFFHWLVSLGFVFSVHFQRVFSLDCVVVWKTYCYFAKFVLIVVVGNKQNAIRGIVVRIITIFRKFPLSRVFAI